MVHREGNKKIYKNGCFRPGAPGRNAFIGAKGKISLKSLTIFLGARGAQGIRGKEGLIGQVIICC